MARLEELLPNTSIRGILPDGLVNIVNVQWYGSEAIELTYKDARGKVANEPLYRYDEPRLRSSKKADRGASMGMDACSGSYPRRTV